MATEFSVPLICGSDYYTDMGRRREPGDRNVVCGVTDDQHQGDHDEMIDGEPGIVTWPRKPRTPRTWHPVSIPSDVSRIVDANGVHYLRDLLDDNRWWKVDPKGLVHKNGWLSTQELLLVAPPLQEIIQEN